MGFLILFTASGISGLMLEVIWMRMLGWLLGATTWSVMSVLVAFMGGLGLGGILWGRRVGRSARPLRLFGLMEVAIGLYGLAVPFLFKWLGHLFVAATQVVGILRGLDWRFGSSRLSWPWRRRPCSMGGTLPVLTRFAAAGRSDQVGRRVGSMRPIRQVRWSAVPSTGMLVDLLAGGHRDEHGRGPTIWESVSPR